MPMLDFAKTFVMLLLLGVLSACGGGSANNFGNGSGSGDGATTAKPTISVTLSNTTVTSAVPATVTITVLDATGKPVVGQVVTITTENSLGLPSTTSVLTADGGQQQLLLFAKAGATTGADNIVATASVAGVAVSGKAGFQIAATAATISSFVSDVGVAGVLGAYGQTNLTATVGGLAAGTPVTLTVNSVCVAKGKATITPSTFTTTSGTASFTFRDQGCGATDTKDDVTLSVSGSTVSSATSIALGAPAVGSITFPSDGAIPSTIFLKGSGFAESSTVSFLVVDVANNPLPNQTVELKLTTVAGGLTIDGLVTSSVTKKSDSNGKVSVLVGAGTVPTPVRVQATLSGVTPVISTVSSTLAVAVGLPSQLNFSLAQGALNIEGMSIDGASNFYTIIASDRMSNPVPIGTAVNFVAEGGSIEAIKQVQASLDGLSRVTANFVAAEPRPANGRVTVVAYALGEESFLDKNGNNVFDSGEDSMDLGDVYIDRRFDGTYDPLNDQFISLSIAQSAACSLSASPLLTLDASIPTRPSTCDGVWGRAYVRRAAETVLSTSTSRPLWAVPPALDDRCDVVNLFTNPAELSTTKFYRVGPGGMYGVPATDTITLILADANPVRLNPMAAGTTVTATIEAAGAGATVTVQGGSPVASTLDASSVALSYKLAANTSATIFVNITSPSKLTTTVPLFISTQAPQAPRSACTL